MDPIVKEFFDVWEDEIAAYQEVAVVLSEQKLTLIEWEIKKFQKVSQQSALLIAKAHHLTNQRHDLMESLIVMADQSTDKYSLRNIQELFTETEYVQKAQLLFRIFSTTLKKIDKLSNDNKELIRTGLELVGDNLEMIADIIDKDRVYSRVGMISQKRNSILLNKRV